MCRKDYVRRILKHILGLCDKHYNTTAWWNMRTKISRMGKNSIKRLYLEHKYEQLHRKHGAYIPISVEFAGRPIFPHWIYGIFISQKAKIGKNCVIFHQVTIGSNTLHETKGEGAPIIGNEVYIGCGAKIIGNVCIGDNVRIGANCVVTKDIPSNATVVLQAPRIIEHREKLDNTFVEIVSDNGFTTMNAIERDID